MWACTGPFSSFSPSSFCFALSAMASGNTEASNTTWFAPGTTLGAPTPASKAVTLRASPPPASRAQSWLPPSRFDRK